MKTCCVPFCNSRSGGKDEKIAFHEFPSNINRRIEWIKAISRIDPKTKEYWIPNDVSVVCSRHFTPDQYSNNSKRKILLPKSVPCIFPGYPDYLLNSPTCKRLSSPPRKGDIIPITVVPNLVKVTSVEKNDANVNKKCSEIKQKDTVAGCVGESPASPEIHYGEDNDSNEVEMDCDEIRPIQILDREEPENIINDDLPKHDRFSNFFQNVSPFLKNSGSSSCDCVYSRIVKKYALMKQDNTSVRKTEQSNGRHDKAYKQLRRQLETTRRQMRRQNDKILKLIEVNAAMTEKIKEYNINVLEQKAESEDPKALFIIDQLRSLKKKNMLWSTSTMEFSKYLERKFPASYSFLRQTDVVSLPSNKMLRFLPKEIDDADSDSVNS